MSFEGDVKKFTLKLNKATDRFIQGVEIALFTAVVMDTPVLTGRLVGNWQTSFNNPTTGTLQDTDPGRTASINRMTATIMGRTGGRITWFSNNLDYATDIEYGASQKAPEGMVRRNVARFDRLVKEQEAKNRL